MRVLFILFVVSLNSCDIKPKDEIHYYEQNKIIDQKKVEILNKNIFNDSTLLGFKFGFNVDEYVNHLNNLIVQDEINGGPDKFKWNVKFDDNYNYDCLVYPDFINKILYEFSCVCENQSFLTGVIGLHKFKTLFQQKYGSDYIYYKNPISKDYTYVWLENGQEITLTYDETYIYIGYSSIYYSKLKDSIIKSQDSLNYKKLKSKF